jgi:hypothetical protein
LIPAGTGFPGEAKVLFDERLDGAEDAAEAEEIAEPEAVAAD